MLRVVWDLIRVRQWYKNLVIFLSILFVGRFFELDSLVLTLIGFFCLCFISSANYVINDIVDLKRDRENPEKKNRPLAFGKISALWAGLLALTLILASMFFAYLIAPKFALAVLAIFIVGQAYNFFLKHEAFADVLTIAVNFMLRSISGAYILNLNISPWIVLCTFMLSIFLSVSKRAGEFSLLAENATAHRSVLQAYTKEVTSSLMIVATVMLTMSYSLYSFLSNKNLIITLPAALYVIFRYFYLSHSNAQIVRHPELVFKDVRMVIGVALWAILIFALLYFSQTLSALLQF